MSRSWDSDQSRRRRRSRRPERQGRGRSRKPRPRPEADDDPDLLVGGSELLENVDSSLLSPDERSYLRARRLAEEKVDLYREIVKAALITVPLLIFITPVGVIVLIISLMKFGRQFYKLMVEPGIRERLVREEVTKEVTEQVAKSVHRERRELKGEHARSLEELSASIAHEIRNPITAAKSLVQQMGEEPEGMDNVEYARVALEELERVERSISHLLRYAREEDMRMSALAMGDVLDSALETFRDRAARENVEILRQFDCEGDMRGDAEKLRRVVINLVGNGLDALRDANVDKPQIEVAMGENLAGTEVWVRIRDNGPGMDEEVRQRIFNPFYTSKQGGTGLGLPITRKLVEAHRGEIELLSTPGQGTEFVLTFSKAGGGPAPQSDLEEDIR